MDSFYPIIASAMISTLVFLFLASHKRTKRHKKTNSDSLRPPEPAGAWPIIGHLLKFIGGSGHQLLQHKLGELADECGQFFTVRLGTRPVFVVSSWEVAKECFTVKDKALASRPEYTATKQMCSNHTMFAFASYGPLWRDMRKTTTVHLLSARRLELLKHVRLAEIDTSIMELYNSCMEINQDGQYIVDLKHWFSTLTLNVIVKMVAGKRYPGGNDDEARRLEKAIVKFFHLFGLSVVTDEFPSALRWLEMLGHERAMKKNGKELYDIVGGWLEEHIKQRNISAQRIKAENAKDFIDVMLSLKEKGELSNFPCEPDTVVKSTCMNLILGGNDTTTATLTWTIAHLLNNHNALRKVQEELDLHVGLDRFVNESDLQNLSYLQAVIKESIRLYPPAPLSLPREALEDCTVAGFKVPAGSRVLFNVWKIQRDPKVWTNPSMFLPERFFTSHAHVDFRNISSTELVAFGGGRRSCPGVLFTIQVIHLTLARLIQAFEMTTPFDEPVDMTEGPGLTTPKATPLKVVLTPRLPAKLYRS